VRVFGIDPGSERTGYGCVETDGSRHTIVVCGAIGTPATASFPDKLLLIHSRLAEMLRECRPDCVAIESVFYSVNVRSALKLGHARGVAMLAAVEAGLPVVEYTPAEIKRAVVGYGRADKPQVQHMVKLLLRLPSVPTPHDAADALAVALCHLHSQVPARAVGAVMPAKSKATSWRNYRPASAPVAAALPPSRLRYGGTGRRGKPARP
jgi:crossover junction endodeoxyribonuclease RuvC